MIGKHEMSKDACNSPKSNLSSSTGSEDRDEESWVDLEPDNENVKFVSLFDDRQFSRITEMFQYCKEAFNVDVLEVRTRLGKPEEEEASLHLP